MRAQIAKTLRRWANRLAPEVQTQVVHNNDIQYGDQTYELSVYRVESIVRPHGWGEEYPADYIEHEAEIMREMIAVQARESAVINWDNSGEMRGTLITYKPKN